MSLTVGWSTGPNDIAEAPQARLLNGPFHDSIIELQDKGCHSLTITSDGVQAIYINTNNTNQENQHLFLYEG